MADLVTKTNGRLSALAEAHDALLSDVVSVALEDLACKLVLPYTADSRNVTISGPEIALANEQVTPICLILHLLASNSAKYGAFGQDGTVSLTWTVCPDQIALTWKEAFASASNTDASAAFGSLLLKTATSQLGGTIRNEWSPDGLQFVVKFPLRAVPKHKSARDFAELRN